MSKKKAVREENITTVATETAYQADTGHAEANGGQVVADDGKVMGEIVPVNGNGDGGDHEPPARPNETKRERFVRLANFRMPKVLARLNQILALSNRSQYEYSEKDIEAIVGTLFAKVEEISTKFQGAKERAVNWHIG